MPTSTSLNFEPSIRRAFYDGGDLGGCPGVGHSSRRHGNREIVTLHIARVVAKVAGSRNEALVAIQCNDQRLHDSTLRRSHVAIVDAQTGMGSRNLENAVFRIPECADCTFTKASPARKVLYLGVNSWRRCQLVSVPPLCFKGLKFVLDDQIGHRVKGACCIMLHGVHRKCRPSAWLSCIQPTQGCHACMPRQKELGTKVCKR
jgi:hypothetical protein